MIKLFLKYLFLWAFGGIVYTLIELFGRGRSHWTMFILGGICFVSLGLINEVLEWNTPMLLQMLLGAVIITALEFITGCIVNLKLGWNVWDYSAIPLNLKGQICLRFSVLWYGLSAVGIILDDYLRYWFFNGEKPRYTLLRSIKNY